MDHTRNRRLQVYGALLLLLAVPFVHAEPIPARGPIPFAAYDQDGNGRITEQEFNAAREARIASRQASGMPMRGMASAPPFAAFDSDGDGQLTPDELAAGQAAQQQRRGGMGMGAGRQQNRQAGPGRNQPTFAEFDLNGDGVLLEEEFYTARTQRIAERARQGFPMRNLGNAPDFEVVDADGDGKITPAEFAAHQQEHQQQMLTR